MRALEARDAARLAAAVNAHIRRSQHSLVEDMRTGLIKRTGEDHTTGRPAGNARGYAAPGKFIYEYGRE